MFKSLPAGSGPPETPRLRKTESVFYALLSDLKPHAVAEFEARLWDQYGLNLRNTVQYHICLLRKKLPANEMITSATVRGVLHYALVRSPAAKPA